jgi:hypothetical protein
MYFQTAPPRPGRNSENIPCEAAFSSGVSSRRERAAGRSYERFLAAGNTSLRSIGGESIPSLLLASREQELAAAAAIPSPRASRKRLRSKNTVAGVMR